MLKKIIVIAVAIVMCLTAFAGCSGDNYGKVKIEGKQDISYTVTSQGGSAVQYGNYVYFINGDRGFTDSDGTKNEFGSVVKGAVYRAELKGEKNGSEFVVKLPENDTTGLDFVSHVEKDYKNDDTNVIDVQAVAPKTVGTQSYSGGGIFIFDNCMYYASPNNNKNKLGAVQYEKTDFFRMTLDGKKTQKIYTTVNNSASSPYMFYSVGNSVYLTVLDGTDLISVKINKKSGKKQDTIKIAENVTSAVMGTKPVYYKGISENTIYDFIVFERPATKDDAIPSGEVLEFIRPDGSSRTVFAADGKSDYKLEGMRDGYLFYRQPKNFSTESMLYATNLHTALCADKAYREDANNANAENIDELILSVSGLNNLEVFAFAPGYEFGKHNKNAVNVITTTKASSSTNQSGEQEQSTVTSTLYVAGVLKGTIATATAITYSSYDGNTLYYIADSVLKKINYNEGITSDTIVSSVTQGTFGADLVGEYLFFFGNVNDNVTAYTFVYDVNGLEGRENRHFIGKLGPDDKISTTESLVVVAKPTKTTYNIGEKLDITGLIVEAVPYADSEGNRPSNVEIKVTEDMLSGFSSSTAGASTVTVKYDGKSVTFDLTIVDPNANA